MQSPRPTLMVVDDDAAVLETLARLLEHFGFNVVAQNDAVTAFAMIQERRDIAGLVCDFEMPGVSGEQLARAAKGKNPRLPVFICSGTYPPDLDSPPWDGWFLKGSNVVELIHELKIVTLPPGSEN